MFKKYLPKKQKPVRLPEKQVSEPEEFLALQKHSSLPLIALNHIIELQRIIGNQTVQRLLTASGITHFSGKDSAIQRGSDSDEESEEDQPERKRRRVEPKTLTSPDLSGATGVGKQDRKRKPKFETEEPERKRRRVEPKTLTSPDLSGVTGAGKQDRKRKRDEMVSQMVIGNHGLRQTERRKRKFVKAAVGHNARREGTRGHKAAQERKMKAEKQLGGKIISLAPEPPTTHSGEKIWSGERAGLSFMSNIEDLLYSQYKRRKNEKGGIEYQVETKSGARIWLPRRKDATPEEKERGAYTSIDHKKPFSEMAASLPTYEIIHGGHRWEVILFKDAKELYNDLNNLVLMQQSENSGKGGFKGIDKGVVKDLGLIDENGTDLECNCPICRRFRHKKYE